MSTGSRCSNAGCSAAQASTSCASALSSRIERFAPDPQFDSPVHEATCVGVTVENYVPPDPGSAKLIGHVSSYELLLIGGGAGVGKTTVAWEVSASLQRVGTAHCLMEGDYMDQIHPAPANDPHRTSITERNIAAVWSNYAALGQSRLIHQHCEHPRRSGDHPCHGRQRGQSHACLAHGRRDHREAKAGAAGNRNTTCRAHRARPANGAATGCQGSSGNHPCPDRWPDRAGDRRASTPRRLLDNRTCAPAGRPAQARMTAVRPTYEGGRYGRTGWTRGDRAVGPGRERVTDPRGCQVPDMPVSDSERCFLIR